MTVVSTDDFNRANGAVGANWTAHGGYSTPTISSNAIQSIAGADEAATYNAADAGSDDMYTKATSTISTASNHNDVIVWCRMPNDATETGYLFDCPTYDSGFGSTGGWTLQRASSGSFVSLATSYTNVASAPGVHTIEVRAVGTTVTGWLDGSQVASVTDATHSGSTKRYGGFHVYSDNSNYCSIDDFEIGNFSSATYVPDNITVSRAAVNRAGSW